MDFGTIRENLEKGVNYKNSKDVFEDVQYIWENCLKYNNKGDYIMDLMKRVKKNFTKYWTAAGLYTESRGTGGESSMNLRHLHLYFTFHYKWFATTTFFSYIITTFLGML